MRSSAVVSGLLSLLLLVLVVAQCSPLLTVDRDVAESLHRSAVTEPGFTQLNRILSDWVWDPWTMRALIAVTVVFLWLRRERRLALWVAGASLLTAALQHALKVLVGRDRPHWPDPVDSARYDAFPSGHALTATVTCGLLLWVLALHWQERWRGWSLVTVTALVSVIGVGWTRVYLGVHWLSDVVAGWLIGVCLVGVTVLTCRAHSPRETGGE
ncbi:phosphatase PAP2 family protein [Streptomyces sp. HUAS MG47]|uniref:phosphatase PAP2 family protein n=1 Tax=Streptomyces solicamelliae TaxID=3231716 RepID=UPI003877F0C5